MIKFYIIENVKVKKYNYIVRMSKISQVIGEGTYGCVLKPSLECKDNKDIKYDDKVSKVLRTTDAKKELKEYKNINSADKNNEFYLGNPVSCDFNKKDVFSLRSIQKCKIGTDVLTNLDKYSLIVMKDGGINVENYVNKVKEWPITQENKKKCEIFLLESLRLFHGLLVFKQHDLLHHDLKPQNVVYDQDTNRLNFIDFGLMQSKKKVLKKSNASDHYLADNFHWSFPWEIEYLNKDKFVKYFTATSSIRKEKYDFIVDSVSNKLGEYYNHIRTYIYYVVDETSTRQKYADDYNRVFDEYEIFLVDDFAKHNYKEFAEKCVDTIDSYGIGFTMVYWLNHAKKHLEPDLVSQLSIVFNGMINANPFNRSSIEVATSSFENVLDDSGLLKKYHKDISHHSLIIETEKEKDIKIDKKFTPDKNIVQSDPGICKPGKERNPKTKRCVNVCKPGYFRNSDFNCIKDKENASCPEGKEKNPKTRRCVKKCKEGYMRNSDFKCIKNKTRKV
jgi:serine/threonine protein kinase